MALRASEHDIQAAYISWVRLQEKTDIRYWFIYHVPNGGHRHKAVAAKMRASGTRPGILDISCDYPVACVGNVWAPGARIEFKAGKNKTTEAQRDTIKKFSAVGYCIAIAWDWQAAAEWTKRYFAGRLESGHVYELG